MKVKTMLLHVGEGIGEGQINQFIKDKKIIDIKLVNSGQVDKEGQHIIIAAIMYDE